MRRLSLLLTVSCWAGGLVSSCAQDDVVLKAMRDELDRSMKQLQLEKLDKPYFIACRVNDRTASTVSSTLGSLIASRQDRIRSLTVEVRVGDYALDNSNFLSLNFGQVGVVRGFGGGVRLPLEDDYKEIRRQIWLATDSAYKKALQDLARKRAALQNKTRGDDIPDFSREEPATTRQNPASWNLDQKRAEDLVRELSKLFQAMPDIYRSSVELEASNDYTRYVNSEGTKFTRAASQLALVARAGTQGVDWKVIFPIYMAALVVTVLAVGGLRIEEKKTDSKASSLRSCLALLKNGYVLAMVGAIFLYVGAEVSVSAGIPLFLKERFGMDITKVGLRGTGLFFAALTIGRFSGESF